MTAHRIYSFVGARMHQFETEIGNNSRLQNRLYSIMYWSQSLVTDAINVILYRLFIKELNDFSGRGCTAQEGVVVIPNVLLPILPALGATAFIQVILQAFLCD